MAPLGWDFNNVHVSIPVHTLTQARKAVANLGLYEAEELRKALDEKFPKDRTVGEKTEYSKRELDGWPIELATFRSSMENYAVESYGDDYISLNKKINEFLKLKCKETGRYVEIIGSGLRLDKKHCVIDVVNVDNDDRDVFEYKNDNFMQKRQVFTWIRQKVLNDPNHPMYHVVQSIIEKRAQEWFRLATKGDIVKLMKDLPGENEAQWLYSIGKIGWWTEKGLLDVVGKDEEWKNIRWFVWLSHFETNRILEESADPLDFGSLFFVQDV